MTPADALMRQIAVMDAAREKMSRAIDWLTSSICPDDATWHDVSKFAQIADAARRFLETFEE